MGEKLRNLRVIFLSALEIQDPEEQKAYLADACKGDDDLRVEVEALLKAHGEAGDFLDSPPVEPDATLDRPLQIEGPGTKIGRYELLELIGEGGMGLVYLAQQKQPVQRRVALKIIKPGMDSKQVIARFEAERQTLAVLDHPNIAHVLDAGTTGTGKPYFVMEYVKGVSITRYCDERKLSIESRLRIFELVCEALQHAHQKGIIHRDIKPSNILVSMQGDRAVPKIIDFGIAKAITQPLSAKTLATLRGQLLGTPQYMSPEQVDLATQDIDTRSDVYSLGVLLYELLTGVSPFDDRSFEHAGFAEIQHTIREVEPASPSARLTTLGEKAKTVATSRGTQVVTLARRLHRELEWIPLKAMRKDRCRRYRSASEMADDVRNYLHGQPLIAGPETTTYRVKKFVTKHAGSVATVALVAVVIVLGLTGTTTMYFRAEADRVRAKRAERTAKEQQILADKRADKYRHLSYVHSVALADAKYREQNLSSAQMLLDSCPHDLRGWEWYRLDQALDQASITIATGSDFLWSIAISPDGERIASGDMDGTITVWDAASGAKQMIFKKHAGPAGSMAFSPDGKRLVSGSLDGTIKVWDVSSGEAVMTLEHGEQVTSILYSLDGRHIASVARYKDKTIKVWDAASGEEMTTIECGEQRSDSVESVALSPDGKQLVAGQYDGALKLWDVTTGKELRTLHGHKGGVFSVSFSPDGTQIVLGAFDGTVKILNAVTGEERSPLKGHGQGGEVASVMRSAGMN